MIQSWLETGKASLCVVYHHKRNEVMWAHLCMWIHTWHLASLILLNTSLWEGKWEQISQPLFALLKWNKNKSVYTGLSFILFLWILLRPLYYIKGTLLGCFSWHSTIIHVSSTLGFLECSAGKNHNTRLLPYHSGINANLQIQWFNNKAKWFRRVRIHPIQNI